LRQLFSVPVASYFYPSKDNPQALDYVSRMKEIHRNNHQSYGRRHIKVVLENQGIFLGVFKIMRLMKSAGIIAKAPKKPHCYPSGNQLPTSPNILKRQFKQDKINTHWVGDITYIRNYQRWSYLATVLDLGSRERVGYALSRTPDAQLSRQVLVNAIKMQQPATQQLLFHSDQGI
jgi:putative transposase